jgi:folate-binding protein YgfZ
VFEVTGPDARDFLQNLVTVDVDRLDREPVLYSGLLSPQGKVIADFFLWAKAGGVLVDVNVTRAEDLRRRLTLYRLRAKVEIADRPDLGVFSGRISDVLAAAPDPRLPSLALRSLADTTFDPPGAEPDAYRQRRIREGAPDLAYDAAPDEVFALEALFDEFSGVGFQKGCFVGQENVSRMKRRATTRRKFCPVEFDGPAPAYGALISAGPAELGSIRTGIDGRAIAFLRLDRAQEASENGVELQAEGRALRLAPPSWLMLPETRED